MWAKWYTAHKQLVDQTAHGVAGLVIVVVLANVISIPAAFLIMMTAALAREIWQHWNRAHPLVDDLLDGSLDAAMDAYDAAPPIKAGSVLDLAFFAIGGAVGGVIALL